MQKNRIVFGILWILSVVGISMYGGAVSYGFFFALTLIPILSYLYLLCVYVRFRIYQEVQSREMICRQSMPYYFVIQNGDYFAYASVSIRLFSGLSYVEEVPDGIEYELIPHDRYTYTTKIVCKYRGEYDIGVREVLLTDFFHLFTLRYQVPSTIKAIVHPRMLQLQELKSFANVNMQLSKENPYGQSELDVVVRDYIPGDELRHIHWKATAKEQTLMTRMQTGEEKQGIVFLCDTKRYSQDAFTYLPMENQVLECLLALVLYFAKQNTPVRAFWGKDKQMQVHGLQDYQNFYRMVSQVSFQEDMEIEYLFSQVLTQGVVAQSKVVCCIVHQMSDRILAFAQQLSALGLIVELYLVTDEDVENYVKQSNSRIGYVHVPIEADLEGIL